MALGGRGRPAVAGLTLQGEPGATVSGLAITGAQRLAVSSLAVVPSAAAAVIRVAASNGVTFRGLSVDGGAGGAGAAMDFTADATGVAVLD